MTPFKLVFFVILLLCSGKSIVLGQVNEDHHFILAKVVTSQAAGRISYNQLYNELKARSFNIDQVENIVRVNQGTIARASAQPTLFRLKFRKSSDESDLLVRLRSTSLFEFVESDHIGMGAGVWQTFVEPNDAFVNRQWYVRNDGSFPFGSPKPGADLKLQEAWNIETGDPSIVVASLDSGVKLSHPEFEGRIWSNPGEAEKNALDDDSNGYIDDIHGWNFIDDSNIVNDDNRHGTHVAGVLAATGNNSIGYAGIDWNCKIMVCKVLDENLSGFYSDFIEAIYYAVDNGANVINMSLGGESYSDLLREAVEYAEAQGVVVVASMQNFNSDKPYYPAAYDPVIAVGATNPDDSRSQSFINAIGGSSFGNHIDVVAPGNFIYGLNNFNTDNYRSLFGGTSLSAPMVSGLASLLLAQNSLRTPAEIRDLIFMTSDDEVGIPEEDKEGWDPFHGFGRINIFRSLDGDRRADISPLFIYPNPTSEQLTIEATLDGPSTVTCSLVSMKGARQQVFTIENARIIKGQISLEGVVPGLYMLLLESRFGVIARKIIKI